MLSRASLLTLVVAFAACGPQDALIEGSEEFSATASSLSVAPGDAAPILALVNYPGTDVATLDGKAGLDVRAAKNIIIKRDGADGISPSADDDLFETLEELDAVPYVADAAFSKLLAFARANPLPAGEVVEGVSFLGWESQSVVWAVNTVSAGVLNGMLDARAAQALIAGRPYSTVTQMGPIAYVGPSALARLQREAATWWKAMRSGPVEPTLAGTFDGVEFDLHTATVALDVANRALKEQLTAHGVTSAAATAIIAGRSYATLADVAAVSGVGPATMQVLKSWAGTGWSGPTSPVTPPAGLTETEKGRAALRSYIDNVLFDEANPEGASFRSNVLDGQTPEVVASIRTQLNAEAAAWTPDAAEWERFENAGNIIYAGRFFQLYTEVRFLVTGATEIYVEID